MIDATVEKLYNSGLTAKDAEFNGKIPCGKPGKGIAPKAKGPITIPINSSPRTVGTLIFLNNFPINLTAKIMIPIWNTRFAIAPVIPSSILIS